MAPTDWVCGESFPLHRWHIFLQCFSWQKGRGISLEALFYKVTNPIEKPKNRCFWTVVLEKTLESPLSCKEIQLVHPKGNQSWILIENNDAEAETPILWLPDVKNWLIGKDPDAGKDWRQEKMGIAESEMVGWHHWPNGHEFKYIPGVGDGHWGLVCCSPWGSKEVDMTERLNWIPFMGAPPWWLNHFL